VCITTCCESRGTGKTALDLHRRILKAYQNLRKLDDVGLRSLVIPIAHNEAYSLFRKRKPETAVDNLEPEPPARESRWVAVRFSD